MNLINMLLVFQQESLTDIQIKGRENEGFTEVKTVELSESTVKIEDLVYDALNCKISESTTNPEIKGVTNLA